MRVRPPTLVGLFLLFVICNCVIAVNNDNPLDIATLRRRVRSLRWRLHAIHRQRRTIDEDRTKVEEEIAQLQTRLDRLAPPKVDDTQARANHLSEVETQINIFESKKNELDRALALLSVEASQLNAERSEALARLQQVSFESIVAAHARGLPPVVQGALRKSAWVLTPFFNMLYSASDTNDRLVAHVGDEIERYTNVGVGTSPFMSGMLFYCVLLIPLLTICVIIRAVIDRSTKLSVTHGIVFGNIYLFALCVIFIIANILERDPMRSLLINYERFIVLSNLILALYYFWLIATLATETYDSKDVRNFAQLVATATIGLHYFIFAWRRIFMNQLPQLLVYNYFIYATIFALITYERCQRINARWLTDCALIRLLRETDAPLPDWDVVFNRNNLRLLQRRLITWCQSANTYFISLLKRTGRHVRRRRNGRAYNSARDSDSANAGSPTTRALSSGGNTRGRRVTLYSRVADVEPSESSDDSSSAASSNEDEDLRMTEPLLSRTTARVVAVGKGTGVLASRSRSRSGSSVGERDEEDRRWWWALPRPSATAVQTEGKPETTALQTAGKLFGIGWARDMGPTSGREDMSVTRVRGTPNRRTKYERNNARPRKERDGNSNSVFSLWKWS